MNRDQEFTYSVSPGRMDGLNLAMQLLGYDAIANAGSWGLPFYVRCTQDDADALYILMQEEYNKVDPDFASSISVRRMRDH